MRQIQETHYKILIETLRLYADPDTYFATFIQADRPAGAINDDWSTHDHPDYDDEDVRPGYAARKALKYVDEYFSDPDPDFDFLKRHDLYTSYYDKDFKEVMKERGVEYD